MVATSPAAARPASGYDRRTERLDRIPPQSQLGASPKRALPLFRMLVLDYIALWKMDGFTKVLKRRR